MAQTTQYKRSFAGSVGAGLGSLMNGKGKTYFILEHKVSSSYHKAGEAQEIIVDQIELGRDSRCQVRFDESFSTVSRRHAAIIRDGDNWKLVQLSQTNQTFLNGHPVQKEWYLQNGDEIQLAVNGPKLGFIIPTGNKSTVGSIGLSRRLSLFRQQALMPYKKAMWVMAAILIFAIVGCSYFFMYQRNIITEQSQQIAVIDSLRLENEKMINTAIKQNKKLLKDKDQLQDELQKMQKKVDNINKNVVVHTKVTGKPIDECVPSVYYLYCNEVKIHIPGNEDFVINDYQWSGTGFLLNDGRLVTARHVVEPWSYISETDTVGLLLNIIANNGGGNVLAHIRAYSSTGEIFDFWSNKCIIDKSKDQILTQEGITFRSAPLSNTDWAYVRVSSKNAGLAFDEDVSKNLKMQTKLVSLGFPLSLGKDENGVQPIYGNSTVAKTGLNNGVILINETSIEHGSSGGPMFCTSEDGGLVVVGIVSAIAGRSTGFIVPISALK